MATRPSAAKAPAASQRAHTGRGQLKRDRPDAPSDAGGDRQQPDKLQDQQSRAPHYLPPATMLTAVPATPVSVTTEIAA